MYIPEKGIFKALKNLEELDLAFNRLVFIHDDALPHLASLNLFRNKLAYVPSYLENPTYGRSHKQDITSEYLHTIEAHKYSAVF